MRIVRAIHVLKGAVHLRTMCSFVFLLVVFFCFPVPGRTTSDAVPAPSPEKGKTLIVGVTSNPPFAMKNIDGKWHGVSWEIWHFAAAHLGWSYEIKEVPLDQIIPALLSGEIDIAAAAFGITERREEKVDFTVPYLITAFGVATAKSGHIDAWMSFLKNLMSFYFLKVLLVLAGILLLVSLLFWLSERRRIKEEKSLSVFKGVGDALLLSAETMTTVGYGEHVPKSGLGQFLALIWMFVSIILLTSFTAGVTSSLTTLQLRKSTYELDDLHRTKVGCLASPSRSALYLQKHQIKHKSFDTVHAALQALSERKLDAVVYDFPTLQYLVHKDYREELTVLPKTFHPSFLALPLAPDSSLRRPLNKAILEVMEMPIWTHILTSYLGRDITPSMTTGSDG